jgi:hypothetical protein
MYFARVAPHQISSLRAGEQQRYDRLVRIRTEADRLMLLVRTRLDAYDVLLRDAGSDRDDRLAAALEDLGGGPAVTFWPAVSEGESESSPERFSRQLLPFARDFIIRSGPTTAKQLAAALPPTFRDAVAALGTRYPVDYRIRRVFRRARDFQVDRKTGRITYVGSLAQGEVPTIEQLLLDDDGTVVAVKVREPDGSENDVPIERFNAEVQGGRLFGVRGRDQVSSVAYVDGYFRSFYDGEFNEDMRNIPRERQKGNQS